MSKEKFELEQKSVTKKVTNAKTVSEVLAVSKKAAKRDEKISKEFKEKTERIAKLRADARKMVSLANKRLRRLEANGLTDTPAYQGYLERGGEYFSVKGKNYQQLQAEIARMKGFIDAETSTVRGTNAYLKNMAENTGIKYKNLKDLRAKAPKFFELASKVEQYLRKVEDMASAIGYEKIWQAINTYTQTQKIDLADSKGDIDKMIGDVTKALTEYEKPITVDGDWYELKK